MQEFWSTISKYPIFFVGMIGGVLLNAVRPLIPLLKKPVTAIALISFFVAGFACLSFTLQAMLGLNPG